MRKFRNYFAALPLFSSLTGNIKSFSGVLWSFYELLQLRVHALSWTLWEFASVRHDILQPPSRPLQLIKMHYWVHELRFNLALQSTCLSIFALRLSFYFPFRELPKLFITSSVHNDLLICFFFAHFFSLSISTHRAIGADENLYLVLCVLANLVYTN